MNFLSHYYLHHDDDPFFTIGLTAPDLISLMGNHSRVTEKFIRNFPDPDGQSLSFLAGMFIHIEIDQWFHRSEFFRQFTDLYQNEYKKFSDDILPHHLAHILLEIMIDRYLLLSDRSLVDGFYESYKSFHFKDVIPVFSHLNHFDPMKFLAFTQRVKNAGFLRDYDDYHKIQKILIRISSSTGLEADLDFENFDRFLNNCYQLILPGTVRLFEDIRKLNITKNNIISKIKEKQ